MQIRINSIKFVKINLIVFILLLILVPLTIDGDYEEVKFNENYFPKAKTDYYDRVIYKFQDSESTTFGILYHTIGINEPEPSETQIKFEHQFRLVSTNISLINRQIPLIGNLDIGIQNPTHYYSVGGVTNQFQVIVGGYIPHKLQNNADFNFSVPIPLNFSSFETNSVNQRMKLDSVTVSGIEYDIYGNTDKQEFGMNFFYSQLKEYENNLTPSEYTVFTDFQPNLKIDFPDNFNESLAILITVFFLIMGLWLIKQYLKIKETNYDEINKTLNRLNLIFDFEEAERILTINTLLIDNNFTITSHSEIITSEILYKYFRLKNLNLIGIIIGYFAYFNLSTSFILCSLLIDVKTGYNIAVVYLIILFLKVVLINTINTKIQSIENIIKIHSSHPLFSNRDPNTKSIFDTFSWIKELYETKSTDLMNLLFWLLPLLSLILGISLSIFNLPFSFW